MVRPVWVPHRRCALPPGMPRASLTDPEAKRTPWPEGRGVLSRLRCADQLDQPRLYERLSAVSSSQFWAKLRTATTPAAAADESRPTSARSGSAGAATRPAKYTPMAVWKNVLPARMSAFFIGSSLSSMVARTRVRGGIRHSDEFSAGQEMRQPGGAARGPDTHADSQPYRLHPGPLELVDPLVEALVALPPPVLHGVVDLGRRAGLLVNPVDALQHADQAHVVVAEESPLDAGQPIAQVLLDGSDLSVQGVDLCLHVDLLGHESPPCLTLTDRGDDGASSRSS